MPGSPLDPHRATPAELQQRMRADENAVPYLLFRDRDDRQVIHALAGPVGRVAVGRGVSADIALTWDRGVSSTHALLERLGDDWMITDDGLSANGTFVNDRRIAGRRRLRHDDVIRVGSTVLAFRQPVPTDPRTAVPDTTSLLEEPPPVSAAQRRVLVALCRPYVSDHRTYPATNREIADELFLAEATVKGHLRALSERFDVGSLPHHRKRAALMDRALASGAVTADDYR